MLKYLKQNKHVIMVAVTLFIISMSTLLFFLGSNNELQKDLKADVLTAHEDQNQTEKKYRDLLHNDKDPFVILNLNGSIEFASPDFKASLGYKDEDITHQLFYLFLNQDDLPAFLKAMNKVSQTGKAIPVLESYHLRTKDNQEQLDVGSAIPLMEKDKVVNIAIISKDISKSVPVDHIKTKPKPTYPKTDSDGKKIFNQDGKEQMRFMAEKLPN